MKQYLKLSMTGSVLAFLLATSCCWLPFLVATLFGTAVGATAFSSSIEPFSGVFMAVGAGLASFSAWRFFQKRKTLPAARSVILQSLITCQKCGFQKNETMPTDACQFFYECENCKQVLKPLAGDCCVFCSYGTVKCPPIQLGDKNCCSK
jgi:hypothetical protein